MRSKQLLITQEVAQKTVAENQTNYFRGIGFGFIKDHCGFRKGCIHTLLSTTSAGKSTLVRSVIRQAMRYNKLTYYSTEESLEQAQFFFSQGVTDTRKLAENVAFLHEDSFSNDIPLDDHKEWLSEMFKEVIAFGSDLLVIDNISTSDYYDGKLKKQAPITNMIARLARASNVAVLVIIHTATGVTQDSGRLIGPDDVRGGRTLSNKSEYFYTLQRFTKTLSTGEPKISTFIKVSKARMHDTSNQIYQLRYKASQNQFIDDRLIPFEDFNNAFCGRDRLGMTKKKGG